MNAMKGVPRALPYSKPQLLRRRFNALTSCTRPFYTSLRKDAPTSGFSLKQVGAAASKAPTRDELKSKDRGPQSSEDTQTDFGNMNVLGTMIPPATEIEACLSDGFHLANSMKITDGDGIMLIGGEAFTWRPWSDSGKQTMVNAKGQFELPEDAWGVLALVHPKPDMVILGVGGSMLPLSPVTRNDINKLGLKVEVQDTRNAAAQFNLLATERGVGFIAAALIPIGFNGNPSTKRTSRG